MKQTDLKNIWNELEDCILLVSNKFPSASLIIGGDFNARLGHSDEQLIKESGMGPLNANDEHWPLFRRHSLDPVTNFAGTCLFLMALRLNLVILNGLSSGDCPGQFTYWSGLRHSVIDYILVSQELFDEYIEFTVDIRTESDHLPLNLKRTEFWEPSRCGLAPQTPDPSALQQIGRSRIKWSPYVNNNFGIWTQSMEGQLLWADLTSNDTEETSPIDHYNTLIRKLQPLLSRPRRSNQNDSPTNKKWFDHECTQAKLILRECFKVFQQNPNPITKLELQLKKKNYKELLKTKKRTADSLIWQALIKASIEKDNSNFWKIISSQTKAPNEGTIIPANSWEEHYKVLFREHRPSAPLNIPLDNDTPWPPTSETEITSLILQMKSGKAPGSDFIVAELLKAQINWWAPVLANLFSYIDKTTEIPKDWGLAIIVPIFKKGNPSDPSNYRPISLLNVICKLYTKHLCLKLWEWLDHNNLLEIEQAGFTSGRSTIDHCLVLDYFVYKYAKYWKKSLYAAFVDLKAAFDSVSRSRLWAKLANMGINRRLLLLMIKLHENNTLQIRLAQDGRLSREIPVQRGVRQGCLLAPFLFNIYVNSLVTCCREIETHPPVFSNGRKVPILMYADDAVLLSQTKVGLKRALGKFSDQCNTELLTINFAKTKIVHFNRSFRKDNWSVKGNAIEQTKTFQYLGITFSYNAKFSTHLTTSAISAERSANAILRLFRRKGAGFLPMALTVFQAKSLAQLLYGSQISPSANLKTLETVQSKFLRSLFATPKCTPNAVLRQEAGLPRVELKVWEQAISLWLKIHYNPKGLLPCFLAAVPYPPWLMQITNKIKQIGLNPENLFIGTLNKAKATITRRLYDIELQQEGALLPETYRCLKAWPNFAAAPYLTNITNEAYRWAFSRARFETMPSAVLYGKFTRVPMHARLCPCMSNKVESVTHILLSCEFYSEERVQLILPLLSKFIPLQYYLESSPEILRKYLLEDSSSSISYEVAKFCTLVIKKRKSLLLNGTLRSSLV